jgi:hypothetical protein
MNEQKINEKEPSVDESSDNAKDASGDGEFKITVRKLEMPVRPRGVLAE